MRENDLLSDLSVSYRERQTDGQEGERERERNKRERGWGVGSVGAKRPLV